ncbi:MAG: succinyldiaminopimelate transaminase [Pseudomonadales bacterium]
MNPRLDLLQPYPFERLNALKAGAVPPADLAHIALSIGEPKHLPPDFVLARLTDCEALRSDLATYPATRGSAELRNAIASWLQRRFGASVDPDTEVLPVAGTREALFSFGIAVLGARTDGIAVLPNPFYQIYEGATLLGGASPYFLAGDPANGLLPDFDSIPDPVWARTELLYVCSPSNPTGRVLPLATLQHLIELAHRYDFVIAADECYSEIYPHEGTPPPGLLQASAAMGNTAHRHCVVFHSLSKRSNLPGLRSGFVAGDARVLERYFLFRTYEGCALPAHVQAASALAWNDETHVIANRAAYKRKFALARELAPAAAPAEDPEGGFYWWVKTPMDDQRFARRLFETANLTVLPGSFLGRPGSDGSNPGAGYVRIAWVAPEAECRDAAQRLQKAFTSL